MSNTELIRELRALTSAGMKDCKDALEETAWDLQKAIDVIKVKGLNIADGRSGRVAADGLVRVASAGKHIAMVEVNCQTDFVANSSQFVEFVESVAKTMADTLASGGSFSNDMVEDQRRAVVSSTKENVVVRRTWANCDSLSSDVRTFNYVHSNSKIGVLLTMKAPSEKAAQDSAFEDLGADLAMQICAMRPLAVSPESISQDEKDRQKSIFETQLKEENKPEKMWEKIIEGKFRKWNTEVCLLEQESVVVPKTSVKQVVKNVGTRLGGEIQVLDFVRCEVGEGIEKKKDNLAEEVAKMM
jgi:elongation factor Ts